MCLSLSLSLSLSPSLFLPQCSGYRSIAFAGSPPTATPDADVSPAWDHAASQLASHGRAHARSMFPLPVELERQFFRGKDLPLLSFFLSIHSASASRSQRTLRPGRVGRHHPSSCHSFLSSSSRSWPPRFFASLHFFAFSPTNAVYISSLYAAVVTSSLFFHSVSFLWWCSLLAPRLQTLLRALTH